MSCTPAQGYWRGFYRLRISCVPLACATVLDQATLVLLFSSWRQRWVLLTCSAELIYLDVNTSQWYYTVEWESKTGKMISLVAQCCALSGCSVSVSTSRDANIKNQIQDASITNMHFGWLELTRSRPAGALKPFKWLCLAHHSLMFMIILFIFTVIL